MLVTTMVNVIYCFITSTDLEQIETLTIEKLIVTIRNRRVRDTREPSEIAIFTTFIIAVTIMIDTIIIMKIGCTNIFTRTDTTYPKAVLM